MGESLVDEFLVGRVKCLERVARAAKEYREMEIAGFTSLGTEVVAGELQLVEQLAIELDAALAALGDVRR